MKKNLLQKLGMLLLLLTLSFSSGSLYAQYSYTVTYNNAVGNPGNNLNTDADATTTNWVPILGPSMTANAWSVPTAIPFSFNFFGTPVSNFIASGNGVVSFTTSATGVPSDANTNLPAGAGTNIPDMSILGFWDSFTGDGATGSNDYVYTKTFGTAPNRQLWIRYHSYEYGANGATYVCSYSYFAIVLEETTNKVYVVDQNYHSGGANMTMTVGVQQNANAAIQYGTNTLNFSGSGSGTAYTDNSYYEFSPIFLANDNAGIAGLVSPVSPLTPGSLNVSATLKNHGSNALTSATINWKVNGTLQTPVAFNGNLSSLGTTTVSLGNATFNAGTNNIEIWSSMPNGMPDADPSNDTLVTSVCSGLTGTYTVGGVNPDYMTLTAAINDLATCGINGPVTINVAPGVYNEFINIPQVLGSDPTNTITIDGGNAATTTLTYNGTSGTLATVTINGTDFLTIKNMTIANTVTAAAAWGIHLYNDASFVNIENCIINMDELSTTTTIVGLLSTNSTTSTAAVGNNCNFVTVKNSTFNGGYYGVRFYGTSSAVPDNAFNKVENCTFNEVYFYGIYGIYQDELTAIGNTVSFRSSTTGGYGLYIASSRHTNIQKNKFYGAKTYGIGMFTENSAASLPTKRSIIANNMISALGTGDGAYLSAALNVDVFYNSITAETDQALWFTGTTTGYDVRNNILLTTGAEVVDFDGTPSSEVVNYNIYYRTDGGTLAAIGATTYANLATWKTGDPTRNVNSLAGDPVFVGATNLHVQGSLANNVGTPIAAFTTDIDGDTRSATMPDIGADEYSPLTCVSPSALNTPTLTDVTATVAWTAGGTETEWQVEFGLTGFTQGSGTLVSGVTTNPYTISGLLPNTTYQFYVRGVCAPGDTSFWNGPSSFTTNCAAFNLPWLEGFESFPPTTNSNIGNCWSSNPTLTTAAYRWDIDGSGSTPSLSTGPAGAYSGNNYAYTEASFGATGAIAELTSPLLNVANVTAPTLTFYYHMYGSTMGNLYVDVFDGTSWNNGVFSLLGQQQINQTDPWLQATVDLTAYSNNGLIQIRFRGERGSNFYGDMSIDDIAVNGAMPTLNPFALLSPADNDFIYVAGPAQNTIDISWEASQTGATYEWRATLPNGSLSTPLVTLPSNNMGMDTVLTLDIATIDGMLASLGVPINDTITLKWTAVASLNGNSLFATTPFMVDLMRLGVSAPLLLKAPQNNGSTTQVRAPNGTTNHNYLRAATIVLPSEFANAGLAPNTIVRSFGFNTDVPIPTGSATGILKLYLQNTTDASYLKGTAWAGITTGMFEVFNDTVTINGGGNGWDVTLDTLFTYGGNAVYVAYDWTLVNTSFSGPITYLATNAIASSLVSANSTTAPPTTLAGSSFRPEFSWGVDRNADDLEVANLYALGKNPLNYSLPEQVQVTVTNNGYLPATKTVTLTITGANTFTTTENVNLLSGESTTINFAPFTATATGYNTMTVSVPADQIAVNNTQTWVQESTTNTFAYADTTQSGLGSVGYNTGSGLLLTRYYVDGAASLQAVKVRISNDAATSGRTVYAVVLDTAGNILAQSANLVVSATTLNTWQTFNLPTPVNVNDEFILVGLAQTANATGYFPVAFQSENPTRTDAYFVADLTGANIAPINDFRFMIEAVVGPGCALSSSTTPTNVSCNGGNNGAATVTPTGAAPFTFAWSNNQTTATITGLTVGTYIVTITDANNCSLTDTVTITEPTALQLGTTAVADTNSSNLGSVTVIPSGGTPNYTFLWGANAGNATTATVTGLGANTYSVTVTDANGCTEVTSVVVDNVVGTNPAEASVSHLAIFPNPTTGNATIQLELAQSAEVNIKIFNMNGQLVENLGNYNTTNQTFNLDLNHYTGGIYFVRFTIDGNVLTRRLVVVK